MAEFVVQALEVVEVEHEDAGRDVAESIEAFEEGTAVGEAGEAVGFGESAGAFLGIAPGFGDRVGEADHGEAHDEHDEELARFRVADRQPADEQVEDGVAGDGEIGEPLVAAGVANQGIEIDRPYGGHRVAECDVHGGSAGNVEQRDHGLDGGDGAAFDAVGEGVDRDQDVVGPNPGSADFAGGRRDVEEAAVHADDEDERDSRLDEDDSGLGAGVAGGGLLGERAVARGKSRENPVHLARRFGMGEGGTQ